jgi:hypothetical protein
VWEENMGFKNLEQQTSFDDLILKDSMDKNRSLEQLMSIHDSIDWARLESVLMSHYKMRVKILSMAAS